MHLIVYWSGFLYNSWFGFHCTLYVLEPVLTFNSPYKWYMHHAANFVVPCIIHKFGSEHLYTNLWQIMAKKGCQRFNLTKLSTNVDLFLSSWMLMNLSFVPHMFFHLSYNVFWGLLLSSSRFFLQIMWSVWPNFSHWDDSEFKPSIYLD